MYYYCPYLSGFLSSLRGRIGVFPSLFFAIWFGIWRRPREAGCLIGELSARTPRVFFSSDKAVDPASLFRSLSPILLLLLGCRVLVPVSPGRSCSLGGKAAFLSFVNASEAGLSSFSSLERLKATLRNGYYIQA